MTEEEQKINQGFDRGVDYGVMRDKLVKEYERLDNLLYNDELPPAAHRICSFKLAYCLIAMIQLRNGSRISEAVDAFRKFISCKKFTQRQYIKIAKSESIKYKRDTKEKYITKRRNREMMFPNKWISVSHIDTISSYIKDISNKRLQKRVLDYMLKYHKCNTHSLRYAFINYMLYDQKRPMTDIAKFVGHSSINQLLTYTQLKNTQQIFDLDI